MRMNALPSTMSTLICGLAVSVFTLGKWPDKAVDFIHAGIQFEGETSIAVPTTRQHDRHAPT
jgi:hypothetical protein